MKRLGAACLVTLGLAATVLASAAPAVSDERAIAHLLSRATFGPRPGDVARVRALGAAAWLEQQLHPERIDDTAPSRRTATGAPIMGTRPPCSCSGATCAVARSTAGGQASCREQLFEGRDLAVTTDFRALFSEIAGRSPRHRPAHRAVSGWRDTRAPVGLFV
jgi:hypothetical protein